MKKKIILVIVIIVSVLLIRRLSNGPSSVVKKYWKELSAGNLKKAYQYIDPVAQYVLNNSYDWEDIDLENYDWKEDDGDTSLDDIYNTETFWDDYNEFLESKEGKELQKEYQNDLDEMDEDTVKTYKALMEGFDFKVKVKIVGEERVSPHLYKVKAKLKETYNSNGEKKNNEKKRAYYVMEKNGKYYIVGESTF